ncbi:CRISPR-associated endonuclease Cas1 [Planctomycetota bacterium]
MNDSIVTSHSKTSDGQTPTRVMALHALLYCERLFYLEEVEEIRLADAAVYAGRRLHDDVVPEDDESPERRSLQLSSEKWGVFGKVDAVRKRDGAWVAYEHKRGRCRRGENKEPLAWASDRIQAIAYTVLLAEEFGESVPQARIRYHADNVTVFVDIDTQALSDLDAAMVRANELRSSTDRPRVTENQNLCPRCSLAPICLPEEERLSDDSRNRSEPRLFPADRQRETLHVTSPKSRIGRSGETLVLTNDEGKKRFPIRQIDTVMLHGFAQISSQAIHLCAAHNVVVHWMTGGGRLMAGTVAAGRTQQRLRQYRALGDEAMCLRLSRQLVHAKVESQLRYLMRATRSVASSRWT